jgi:hypothetical protein
VDEVEEIEASMRSIRDDLTRTRVIVRDSDTLV